MVGALVDCISWECCLFLVDVESCCLLFVVEAHTAIRHSFSLYRFHFNLKLSELSSGMTSEI